MSKKTNQALIDPDSGEELVENRARVWAMIIYPGDSCPDNWEQMMEELIVPIAVSPLHTHEKLADGSEEKDHRHVILNFGGVKSQSQVKLLMVEFRGTIPIPVSDIRAYTRYLIHLDQPNKTQYDRADIITYCDYDLETNLLPSKGYMMKICSAMTNYIIDNEIVEFSDFAIICQNVNLAWYDILLNEKTSYFEKLIRSYRNKIKEAKAENQQ